MMKFVRDAIRGAGRLPGYGEHPGTGFAAIMLFMLLVAGATNENLELIPGLLSGLAAWAVLVLPLYIVGCVGRARDYDRDNGIRG